MLNRRSLLKSAVVGGMAGAAAGMRGQAVTLPPWTPGILDIHHLAYGRGNATFILCPDGTTMLIDAGTTEDSNSVSCAQRPNSAMRPGQWIASYALRQMRAAVRQELDYALITHLHPDHLGDLGTENPPSADGKYRLTGISDVAAQIPIATLIDRAYPTYSYPVASQAPYLLNYVKFVRSRQEPRQRTERIQVGAVNQIRLVRDARSHPGFQVRNLAANGEIWTGSQEETRHCFPDLQGLQPSDFPNENLCSIAIRLSYGKFDYFTGGDLTADTEESGLPWRDMETPVAKAAGPVEVAVANHHGYYDAVGPEFVRALQARVFVIPSWYVAHPAFLPLRRMSSRQMYPGDRDIYATCVMDANRAVNNQLMPKVKSVQGHVVVRVARGGDEFRVFVTDNTDDNDRIQLATGPYRCS